MSHGVMVIILIIWSLCFRTMTYPDSVKLLTLILKCNNFEFNGKHYLQVQGTTMGTKMAPTYANIFMDCLKGQLLRSVALRPLSWLRFIDHIDMKWSHGCETLTTFLNKVNNFHPSIKFTTEISTKQHVFLDNKSSLVQYLLISIQNQKIHTCISYPQVATRNTAAKIFLIALHFFSNVSAPIQAPLNQEQEQEQKN